MREAKKTLSHQADKVLEGIQSPLMAMRDLGEHMKNCPFQGWTMQECIKSLAMTVRARAALMPIPTDPKAAKSVRALLREARLALDELDGGAQLLDDDFDGGVKHHDGAAALGAAIESLTEKAGVAFESAAVSMGADKAMFSFYEPPREAQAA